MTPSDTSLDTSPSPAADATTEAQQPPSTPPAATTASDGKTPSYVKLAMRNMVKKGGKSLFHFFLSAVGLLTLLVGLAYLTR